MAYSNAGSGLKKVFICQIGSLICTVLMIIPLINFLVPIASCVFLIFGLIGLNEAGKDIEGCKTAFYLTITQLVIAVLLNFLDAGITKTILSTAISITDFFALYFVCSSVAKVLRARSYEDIAAKGEMIWKINLAFYIGKIIVSLLTFLPLLEVLVFPIQIIMVVASLAAGILYITFLYKSSKVL